MELNLWNSNKILLEWLEEHQKNILKCDFDFDIAKPSSNRLLDVISEKMNIERECIALSAGISELISCILFSALWRQIYVFCPEFGLYERCIKSSIYKDRTTFISMNSVHIINKLIDQYETGAEDLLCVSSPNWYSGERLNYSEILHLLDCFHGTIVIDEAYVDYANEPASLIHLAETHNRLILLRSFSKGWFISGLRIGYMVSKEYAELFRDKIIVPHSVSTPSMRIVQDLLRDEKLMQGFHATRKDVIKTREYIKKELRMVDGCSIWESEANFVTILLDRSFEKKISEVLEVVGTKVLNVQTSEKMNIKYWISNMDNAVKLVEVLRNKEE